MNFRGAVCLALLAMRGQETGTFYRKIWKEFRSGITPETTDKLLIQMLLHCKTNVPYYAEIMSALGDDFHVNPREYLKRMPILTKSIIRSKFERMKSKDLNRRHWFLNTSGGSTGEPVQFIQDWEYADRAGAVSMLYSKLAGRELGEPEILLWGSERDILRGSDHWRTRAVNNLSNTTFLNAFRMSPERMREFIGILNREKPKLIVAYVDAIYELAKFSEREKLGIVPQAAIITSAGTLYPLMRGKIEKVFGCRVYNRYGSREVYDVACERPECDGLWVAPWGNFVEIADDRGNNVPDGVEGEILVTSLTNFAMPLIRYKICDTGVLSPKTDNSRWWEGQVLKAVTGRNIDVFRNKNGVLVHAGYFINILFFKDWILKFQVVQKAESSILFRIIKSSAECPQSDLDEIVYQTKMAMSEDCEVNFEFVDNIPTPNSGKYRYVICELQDNSH